MPIDPNIDKAVEAESKHKTAAIASALGIVDRVLSPTAKRVVVVNVDNDVPAWTDNETITLNAAVLPALSSVNKPEDLIVWLGANGHEVGHTMFSPKPKSGLMKLLRKLNEERLRGILRVENLVEDQRMERLVIGRFQPWRAYLSTAAVHLSVELPMAQGCQNIGELWPWLAGRTWLPAEYRKAARDAYPGDAAELADLIGQYQRLWDPAEHDMREAVDLLDAIRRNLLDSGVWPDPEEIPGGCGFDHDQPGQPGEPGEGKPGDRGGDHLPEAAEVDDDDVPSAGSEQDNEQLDDADELGDVPQDGDGDADTDGDGDGDGDGSDGDGDAGDTGAGDDGSGDAEGEGAGDDGADADTDGGNTTGGSGANDGTGDGKPKGLDPNDLDSIRDGLSQAISNAVSDQLANDQQLRNEIADLKSALDDDVRTDGKVKRDPSRDGQSVPVPGEVGYHSHHLSSEFAKLVAAAEAGWHPDRPSGRLNVDRLIDQIHSPTPDFDTIFDEWKPGAEDEVSLDVTILLDTSSSMGFTIHLDGDPRPKWGGGLITPASQAVWQIRRAVEKADGVCRVITFDTESYLRFDETDRTRDEVYTRLPSGGGTNPTSALEDTWDRLRTVDAAHKLVIVVTDGQWGGGMRYDDGEVKSQYLRTGAKPLRYVAADYIHDMRQRGIHVIGIVIDPYYDTLPHGEAMMVRKQQGVSDADKQATLARKLAEHKKASEDILRYMAVDPELSRIYTDPIDMVEQFRVVAERLMVEAMEEAGVAV